MKIRFMSLGSGSSGNCYYLGTDTHGIFVDAGVGIRTIRKICKDYALSLETIKAIFVTHDHADHIKAIGHLAGKYNIPIYTTPEVHQGIARSYCMTEKLNAAHTCFIHKEESIRLNDFIITCFEVPHDGSDNVGYCIEIDGKTFTFLTDIGHITETVGQYIQQTNYLIMEANYDESMLQMGPYPQHLKVRIASPNGHMCNREMAEHLAEHFPPHLKHIWLCHLSKENNHPDLALKTVEIAFKSKKIIVGKDIEVTPLRRTIPSEMYIIE